MPKPPWLCLGVRSKPGPVHPSPPLLNPQNLAPHDTSTRIRRKRRRYGHVVAPQPEVRQAAPIGRLLIRRHRPTMGGRAYACLVRALPLSGKGLRNLYRIFRSVTPHRSHTPNGKAHRKGLKVLRLVLIQPLRLSRGGSVAQQRAKLSVLQHRLASEPQNRAGRAASVSGDVSGPRSNRRASDLCGGP